MSDQTAQRGLHHWTNGDEPEHCWRTDCDCTDRTARVDRAPGRVRRNDHASSRAGARDVGYRAGSQKARLLAVYEAAFPEALTDEEAARSAGLYVTGCCYWKRCSELRDAGAIIEVGTKRVGGDIGAGGMGKTRLVCRVRRTEGT